MNESSYLLQFTAMVKQITSYKKNTKYPFVRYFKKFVLNLSSKLFLKKIKGHYERK